MWEYRHAYIHADSLEIGLANWCTRDGWEYVDRHPYTVSDGTIRFSVLFRRAKIETAPIPVKANEMYYIPLPEREKRY